MRFLSLDLSTNTGYAVFEKDKLLDYGVFTDKAKNYKSDIKTFADFPEQYPYNFIATCLNIGRKSVDLFHEYKCEAVVIEHTEKGKQRLSQRLLEWINYAVVAAFIVEDIRVQYLLVSDWRTYTKCYLKYWPDHKAWNTKINRLKQKAIPTKSGAKVAKLEGKIVTKVNQKKLSILLANEAYDLTIKDDNIADAINLGRAGWGLLYGGGDARLSADEG